MALPDSPVAHGLDDAMHVQADLGPRWNGNVTIGRRALGPISDALLRLSAPRAPSLKTAWIICRQRAPLALGEDSIFALRAGPCGGTQDFIVGRQPADLALHRGRAERLDRAGISCPVRGDRRRRLPIRRAGRGVRVAAALGSLAPTSSSEGKSAQPGCLKVTLSHCGDLLSRNV